MTRYAESALKAASHTHLWWPTRVRTRLYSKFAVDHILIVESAEQVARCLRR